VAALVATAIVPDERARAVVPGTNGKIVFGSDRDSSTDFVDDIYSMDSSGSGAMRLTTNPAHDLDPTWSPDGEQIAFTSTRDGNHEIYVMDANGSLPTRLTTNAAADDYPTWSPDGQKIAFTSARDGNAEIYVMDANGSNQTRLTNAANTDEAPSWSPDGQKIAFASGRDGNLEIYVMNANGSSPTRLTTNAAFDRFPAWSPNGLKIAFDTNRDGNSEVYSMDANGSSPTNLSNDPNLDFLPAWSPDGQQIAFETARGPDFDTDVFVMNADGSVQVDLTTNTKSDDYPDWQTIRPDADRDGLLDSWEIDGIDADNNGTPELDLPAMGADPNHKDIFLELDVMAGHAFSQTAIDNVITAFANAPVSNPDASTGINLHVDNGPGSVMAPSAATWGALSDQDVLAHDLVLGSYLTGRDYDWSDFDAIKAANFSPDREPAFHYVVSGHRYGSATEASGGISRGIEASDLLLTLGTASEPGEGSGTPQLQAAILMHELGHNLGLRHGGDDNRNYKPNYLSIMNYSFNLGWLRQTNGTRVLDYSRFQIPLDELALNEPTGLGRPAGSAEAGFWSMFTCPNDPAPPFNPSQQFRIPVSGVVDWNCNQVLDANVTADINDDGGITVSTSINDWNALVYDGGAVGSPGGTVTLPATTQAIEAPIEQLMRSAEALDGPLFPQPTAQPPAATPAVPAPAPAAAKKCKKPKKHRSAQSAKKKCKKKKRK
jgi:Tol biopolymer transport system component